MSVRPQGLLRRRHLVPWLRHRDLLKMRPRGTFGRGHNYSSRTSSPLRSRSQGVSGRCRGCPSHLRQRQSHHALRHRLHLPHFKASKAVATAVERNHGRPILKTPVSPPGLRPIDPMASYRAPEVFAPKVSGRPSGTPEPKEAPPAPIDEQRREQDDRRSEAAARQKEGMPAFPK